MNRVAIRVIGAPLLLAGLALCVYADFKRDTTTAVTVLIACFALISFHELCAMARAKGLRPAEVIGLIGIMSPYASRLFGPWTWASSGAIAAVVTLAVLAWMVVRSPRLSPLDAAFTLFTFAYLSLLLFIFDFHGSSRDWLLWLLFLVATNKGSDMAAYVVGKRFGRHLMAPAISPKKTWEGAVAGLVVGTAAGFFVLREVVGGGVVHMIIVPAVVTMAAQLGDLVKSVIKRWAGVKDSGRFLPEFGGALDMIDSFILSAPVAILAMGVQL